MRRLASVLILVFGFTLFVCNATRLGIDASRIRRTQENRERFGDLERVIANESAIIAAEGDLTRSDPASASNPRRAEAALRLSQAIQLRLEAQRALGSHSSEAEAMTLRAIYASQTLADVKLIAGLLVLFTGIAWLPMWHHKRPITAENLG